MKTLDGTPKVILRKPVVEIERYLCYKEPKDEWCGLLFYKMEGNLEDPDNITIEVLYLYPMDVGTSASTSIENHEEVLDLYDERPELEEDDIRQGFIHSHNTMGTYFSGTDQQQLKDGAEDFDFFLSVITNNEGDYIARVSFQCSEERKTHGIMGFGSTKTVSYTGQLKCKIEYDLLSDPSEFIRNRFEELQRKKSFGNTPATRSIGYGTVTTYGTRVGRGAAQQDFFEGLPEGADTTFDMVKKALPMEDYPEVYNGNSRNFMAASILLRKMSEAAGHSPTYRVATASTTFDSYCADTVNKIYNKTDGDLFKETITRLGFVNEIIEEMGKTNYAADEIIAGLLEMERTLHQKFSDKPETDVKIYQNQLLNAIEDLASEYLIYMYSQKADQETETQN